MKANEGMWKVNIDGGGIGEWSKIPEEAINLSVRLAKNLEASWVNIDMIVNDGEFLITEFSPVWHHYAYKEKPSFVYKDDYNIDTPLEVSLDLERIVIESLLDATNREKSTSNRGDREGNTTNENYPRCRCETQFYENCTYYGGNQFT
jgi:hypothetical protein